MSRRNRLPPFWRLHPGSRILVSNFTTAGNSWPIKSLYSFLYSPDFAFIFGSVLTDAEHRLSFIDRFFPFSLACERKRFVFSLVLSSVGAVYALGQRRTTMHDRVCLDRPTSTAKRRGTNGRIDEYGERAEDVVSDVIADCTFTIPDYSDDARDTQLWDIRRCLRAHLPHSIPFCLLTSRLLVSSSLTTFSEGWRPLNTFPFPLRSLSTRRLLHAPSGGRRPTNLSEAVGESNRRKVEWRCGQTSVVPSATTQKEQSLLLGALYLHEGCGLTETLG